MNTLPSVFTITVCLLSSSCSVLFEGSEGQDGVPLCPENFVPNGSFDDPSVSWSSSAQGSMEWQDEVVHSGKGAAQVLTSASYTTAGVEIDLKDQDAYLFGQQYRLSAWVRCDTPETTAEIRISEKLSDDDRVQLRLLSCDSWTKLVVERTMLREEAEDVRLSIFVPSKENTKVFVDDICYQRL